MNQAVTFNFAIVKTGSDNVQRVYQLIVLPGSPWGEIDEVLVEFQKEIAELKLREEKKAQEEQAKKNEVVSEEDIIEPEVLPVSE